MRNGKPTLEEPEAETMEFDPIAALKEVGLSVGSLPEEIPLELTEEADTSDVTREMHQYGAGNFVGTSVADELVIGHGAGVSLPDPDNVVSSIALDALDQYADERERQKDGPFAMRFNEGKLRFDLIPPEAVEGLAGIYTMGAKKYADRNWEKGLQLMSCFASLMRHAWKWAGGEDLDQESGLHHMDHVAWNAVAISTFFKRGRKDLDDRPVA